MKKMEWKSKKGVYLLTIILMLLLDYIFLNSFYWPTSEIGKKRIFTWIIALFGVSVVPVLVVKIDYLYNRAIVLVYKIEEVKNRMLNNKRRILLLGIISFAGVMFAVLITYVISRFILRTGFNSRLLYSFIFAGLLLLCLCCMWKNAYKKPERIFVVIALVLGMFCISVTPCRVGVSWDDEIHYERTLEIADYLNNIRFKADEKNIADYGNNIGNFVGYDRTSDEAYTQELNDIYKEKQWSGHEFNYYGIWSISYIPSVIGILLGRGLNLPYEGVFNMGRMGNLLIYIFLIYCAIKKVKYGKVLIASIGLIPTTIFMAASYSYDPWLVGFTILGFSYLVAELQDDSPLEYRNIFMMIGMILIGCIPKAIYFPLLFPLLFMPKKKFRDQKQRVRYYGMVVAAGLFLVMTFMLPMLIGGAGEGDLRGGSDVNSTEQIKFMLQNPMLYTKILFEYLRGYIALDNSGAMLQRFAYVGHGYLYSTVAILLPVVAFLDRGDKEKNYVKVKFATIVGCAVTIILSITALYISFTAVGSNTVAGMQGRYMLPTIYPALYALGIGGVSHKINKNAFVVIPMILIAITLFYNMIKFCVILY